MITYPCWDLSCGAGRRVAACDRAGRLHECCAGVAAQTTAAQTVWVVNFYSTTKTINAATMNRHAETPLAGNIIAIKASVETAPE